jgi:hypothetical protein
MLINLIKIPLYQNFMKILSTIVVLFRMYEKEGLKE